MTTEEDRGSTTTPEQHPIIRNGRINLGDLQRTHRVGLTAIDAITNQRVELTIVPVFIDPRDANEGITFLFERTKNNVPLNVHKLDFPHKAFPLPKGALIETGHIFGQLVDPSDLRHLDTGHIDGNGESDSLFGILRNRQIIPLALYDVMGLKVEDMAKPLKPPSQGYLEAVRRARLAI